MSAIALRDVYRSFGGKKVLRGVDFTINKGETFLLIGRSGAGKTVLLKNIIGLLRPDSGSITINDVEITELSSEKLEKILK